MNSVEFARGIMKKEIFALEETVRKLGVANLKKRST